MTLSPFIPIPLEARRVNLQAIEITPLMSSNTTPSTSNEPITPDATNTPSPPPRLLTGGCVCKSIRYKIARDECQERMNMSMCSLQNG